LEGPFIRVEDSGELFPLRSEVTTVGRGSAVDVRLGDPSVSQLHAEIIRRGPYTYVVDLGLSRNGTRVNGRPVARRVLEDGDVVSFGAARCRVGGVPHEDIAPEVELRRSAAPELTRRELDVLTSLCRPALSDEAFVAPATAREIAADLVVTEAAVKQHLLRLYQKFRIPEGPNRRTRLANEVVALGLVRPLPPAERGGKPEPARPAGTGPPGAAGPSGPQGTGPPAQAPSAASVQRGGAAHGGGGPQGSAGPAGGTAAGSTGAAGGGVPGGAGGSARGEQAGPAGHGAPSDDGRDGLRLPRPRGRASRPAGRTNGAVRAAGRRAS
jgi:FHA domain